MHMDRAHLRCIKPRCGGTAAIDVTRFTCPRCDGLMDVVYDFRKSEVPSRLTEFDSKRSADPLAQSGVWRFRALLPFTSSDRAITIGEGRTLLRPANQVATYVDLAPGRLLLQYEGFNPSGSFKDNGMVTAFAHARLVGARRAACASTGNTSASLALCAAATGLLRAIVFVGAGKISYGKLAQALDHGALSLQIAGDFDDAMRRVQAIADRLGVYLVNSINPFRLEGQKTIMYRVLEGLRWQVPDWIVVPGGNLGNVSAFGKAFVELMELELIGRMPRFAVINAAGADTLYQLYENGGLRWSDGCFSQRIIDDHYRSMDARGARAFTIASAIEINRPVNLPKALRTLEKCGGVVRAVTDEEILDAKAKVGAGGFGCEPASAAGVAGVRKLRQEGVIDQTDRVVCILTGHALKDPTATVTYHGATDAPPRFANRAIPVPNDENEIIRVIEEHS
jgi:threonine synthase